MAVIKLKAGQSVMVAAVDPSLEVGGGPMPGGGDQPVDPGYGIDLGLGVPTHPIVLPPEPTQPLPPSGAHPDQSLPGRGSAGGEHPDNTLPPPEEIPPPIEPPTKPTAGWELKTAWTPTTGWVVVAIPTGPHATPSKKR